MKNIILVLTLALFVGQSLLGQSLNRSSIASDSFGPADGGKGTGDGQEEIGYCFPLEDFPADRLTMAGANFDAFHMFDQDGNDHGPYRAEPITITVVVCWVLIIVVSSVVASIITEEYSRYRNKQATPSCTDDTQAALEHAEKQCRTGQNGNYRRCLEQSFCTYLQGTVQSNNNNDCCGHFSSTYTVDFQFQLVDQRGFRRRLSCGNIIPPTVWSPNVTSGSEYCVGEGEL